MTCLSMRKRAQQKRVITSLESRLFIYKPPIFLQSCKTKSRMEILCSRLSFIRRLLTKLYDTSGCEKTAIGVLLLQSLSHPSAAVSDSLLYPRSGSELFIYVRSKKAVFTILQSLLHLFHCTSIFTGISQAIW